MRFHNVFDDAQTNSNPLSFPPQFRAEAIEPLKDPGVFVRWNAWTMVLHRKVKARPGRRDFRRYIVGTASQRHHDSLTIGRVFYGVINQVHQRLLDRLSVNISDEPAKPV